MYLLTKGSLKKLLFTLIVGVFLSSCASIFNSKTTELTIIPTEKTAIEIVSVQEIYTRRDTISEHNLRVLRGEEILNVKLTSADRTKSVYIFPKNSFAYALNFVPFAPFPTYLIPNLAGVLIDRNNPKRYTYPKNIYVDMEKEGNDFTTYRPLEKVYQGYNNILKINLLKMASLDVGGVEMSFERKTSDEFSTQLTAAYTLPAIWNFNGFKPRKLSGFQLAVEERYYWGETAPVGFYLAGEFVYLNNSYYFTDAFIAENQYYTVFYEDEFKVKKQTFSLNAKIGKQFFIKRFSVDFSVGAGLRYKNVKHRDIINPDARFRNDLYVFPERKHLNNRAGRYLTVSLPMSLKVGWLF